MPYDTDRTPHAFRAAADSADKTTRATPNRDLIEKSATERSMPGTVWIAILLFFIGAISSPPANAQLPVAGPSFPCPTPRDPLAQLICDTPVLAKLDLAFVQSYQALRQQLADPAPQQELRQETIDFGLAVRSLCGIALAQGSNSKAPAPPPAPSGSAGCVIQMYERQYENWRSRLSGSAAEEAARPIETQIGLQTALQRMGFLAANEVADGVFGSATRAAIVAWQTADGRAPSGLLGTSDARALIQAYTEYAAGADTRQAAARREERRLDLTAKFGARAEAIMAGQVQLDMTQEEVTEAKGRPRKRESIPPNYEIWAYDGDRVAFTDKRVTHVGH